MFFSDLKTFHILINTFYIKEKLKTFSTNC